SKSRVPLFQSHFTTFSRIGTVMSLNKLLRSRAAIALTLACWLPLAPLAVQAQASAPAAAAAPDASAPAAAVPAPAPAPLSATTTKETTDNPYGLNALWQQGDFVARGTLLILVIMSMGSWYILVTKLYESLKIAAEARAARKGFFKHPSLNDAAKTLKQGSAFRFIA